MSLPILPPLYRLSAPPLCAWSLVTGPAVEPVTLAEVKAQARIADTNSDTVLALYIQAAREAAERYMNRGLYTQTWKLVLDRFYEEIQLPRAAPLQSVTSITYYDTDAVSQTLSSTIYTVDTVSRPGRVVRASDQSWPALQSDRLAGKVTITYVIGWTSTALIPERIKQGIRLYVTGLDRDRDGSGAGETSRKAAQSCWDDQVAWSEPSDCVAWA